MFCKRYASRSFRYKFCVNLLNKQPNFCFYSALINADKAKLYGNYNLYDFVANITLYCVKKCDKVYCVNARVSVVGWPLMEIPVVKV